MLLNRVKVKIHNILLIFDMKKRDQKATESTCRICLSNENTSPEDPNNSLVSPCACSGSVKYVHIDCLKQWIKSKGVSKIYPNCITYIWKILECELCHRNLPGIYKKIESKLNNLFLRNFCSKWTASPFN